MAKDLAINLRGKENVSDKINKIEREANEATTALTGTAASAAALDAVTDEFASDIPVDDFQEMERAAEGTSRYFKDVTNSGKDIQRTFDSLGDFDTRDAVNSFNALSDEMEEFQKLGVSEEDFFNLPSKQVKDISPPKRKIKEPPAVDTTSFVKSMAAAEQSLNRAERASEDFNREQYEQAIALGMSSSAAYQWAASAETMAQAADSADDEIEELNREITQFSFETLAASVNIGPFNFQLRQMAIQIPALLTLFGGLTTAIAGVTSAAVTAGIAFGGIFGAGLLVMSRNAAEANSELEGTMEGIQEVIEGFRDEILEGLEPLMNPQSVAMLERFISGVARLVRVTSGGIAGIQDFLSVFQSDIGDAFFHAMPSLVREIQSTIIAFAPFIEDFIYWFMDALPRALSFFEEQGVRILPTIAAFGKQLITTTRAFSEFGITLFKAVLPVLSVFLEGLTAIIDVVNGIPDGFLVNALKFGAFIYLAKRSIDAGRNLAQAFKDLKGLVADMSDDFEVLARKIAKSEGNMNGLNEAFREFNESKEEGLSGEAESGFLVGLAVDALTIIGLIQKFGLMKRAALAAAKTVAGTFGASVSGTIGTVAAAVLAVVGAVWLFQDALATGFNAMMDIIGAGAGMGEFMESLRENTESTRKFLSALFGVIVELGEEIFNMFSVQIVAAFKLFGRALDIILNDLGPLNEIVAFLTDLLESGAEATDNWTEKLRNLRETIDGFGNKFASSLEGQINNVLIDPLNEFINIYNKLIKKPVLRRIIAGQLGTTPGALDPIDQIEDIELSRGDFVAGGQQSPAKTPKPEITVENDNSTNVETIEARPEDQQRIKGLVKDALDEANTFRRKKDAYSG